MKLIFIIILPFFVCSCNTDARKKQSKISSIDENIEAITIDLDKTEHVQEILISSIFKKVTPIILELTDESMLADIDKLIPFGDYLIINDLTWDNGVYLFYKDGKFARKIGKKGNGSGEYLSPSDCTVNYTDSLIYVLDGDSRRILTYKLPSGEFIGAIKLQNSRVATRFIEYSDGKLYTDLDYYTSGEEDYMLREIDLKSGEEISAWLSNNEYNKGYNNRQEGVMGMATKPFYNSRSYGLKFIQAFMDDIVDIRAETICPVISIAGKQILTREELHTIWKENNNHSFTSALYELPDKIYNMYNYIEGPNFIMFYYRWSSAIQMVVYDKNTGHAKVVNIPIDDLVYNVSGGNSKTRLPLNLIYSDQEGAYGFINLDRIERLRDIAAQNKLNLEGEYLEKIKGLSEDSNPVVMYYEY